MKQIFVIKLFNTQMYYKEDVSNTFKPAFSWTSLHNATHYNEYGEAAKALEAISMETEYFQIEKYFTNVKSRN